MLMCEDTVPAPQVTDAPSPFERWSALAQRIAQLQDSFTCTETDAHAVARQLHALQQRKQACAQQVADMEVRGADETNVITLFKSMADALHVQATA